MKKHIRSLLTAFMLGTVMHATSQSLDLSGQWTVTLGDDATSHAIMLPTTTDIAGLGTPDTLKPLLQKPQLLRLTRRNSFVGRARYTRTIDIPVEMASKPLALTLERVLWKSTVTIDGKTLATTGESLTTPHRFVIADGLAAGSHTVAIEVDNTKQYNISAGLAHAYTDDTQIRWNGILGDMTLGAIPETDMADIRITPDITGGKIGVRMIVDSSKRKKAKETFDWEIGDAAGSVTVARGRFKATLNPGRDTLNFDCPIGDNVELWSEFNPALYRLTIRSRNAGGVRSEKFGMREIASRDRHILVNGHPVFLRGTLECCVFPLTGNPPLDEAGWEKEFDAAAEWGLNHFRFHSWCPPEAAFAVADRKGFYLQVELPLWDEVGDDDMKGFLSREYRRIVSEYGNHPSFCMLTIGNELGDDFEWMNSLVEQMKREDSRHLYAATSFSFSSGHGGHPEPYDDFMVTQWTDKGWVRGQGVFNAEPPSFAKDYGASMAGIGVPLVSHEIGQYSVYPDLREIPEYSGTLAPHNFEAVRDDLLRKGRLDRAAEYLDASGRLAAILYKEDIERAMKTPGFSGYQLLGLQDFPGQGTALVGLLNAFWESKGVAEASWFRQFCAPVVPLARFDKAVYRAGETFDADIDISNYSMAPLDREVRWSLRSAGRIIDSGAVMADSLPEGLWRAGRISVPLASVTSPERLTLTIEAAKGQYSNQWNIWVYPDTDVTREAGSVVATTDIDEALAALEGGRRVLLTPPHDSIRGMESRFVPVFWSPVHFPNQAGGMGLLCDPAHPALAGFPTAGHTDWQWWHLVKNARVVNLDSIDVTPIVEVVDNFTNNRRLALMFEARCGNGSLVFSAMELLNPEIDDPSTRCMLASVLDYMNSDSFRPAKEVAPGVLGTMVAAATDEIARNNAGAPPTR